MKPTKHLIVLITLFFFGLNTWSSELQFKNGKFKIVQFTDLHIRLNDSRSDIAFERMNQVLDNEAPDLVILTGDMIYNSPADENFKALLSVFESRKQPFAITFGNHDREQGLSNQQLFDIATQFKYNVTTNQSGISGIGNCAIPINTSSAAPACVIYLFDSGRDCELTDAKGYDYIHFDQIDWYRKTSDKYTKVNGSPVPSLAFFHIPLPEYAHAVADHNAAMYGIRRETPCPSKLNSGIFASMKEKGDIMGVFAGHDHDNDYAVNYLGILLAYGRFTGGPTEYTNIPNGARIIELTEGQPGFRIWIRTASGIEQSTQFPSDYIKK